MSLAPNVVVEVNKFSLETSKAEAEAWLKRKTVPGKPLWVRAKEVAIKERAISATLKPNEKKKKDAKRKKASLPWWSVLEVEKRKNDQPVVIGTAPNNVISCANRALQKEQKILKQSRVELLESVKREAKRNTGVGGYSRTTLESDPFGLLDGAGTGSFLDDSSTSDPILDIYGLHDKNTLQSVAPCRVVSLLRPLPQSIQDRAKTDRSEIEETGKTVPTPTNLRDRVENQRDRKTGSTGSEPRPTMSTKDFAGVGRLIARTSFGRAMGAFKSPPEPEGGDEKMGGNVGQLLEVWVWLSTSKKTEHLGGPVNMNPVVLAEFLEKKHLTPSLPASRDVEGYSEHCVQVVERCAEIIRMAQTVVEDDIAKDYFLALLLRASHKWDGLPLKYMGKGPEDTEDTEEIEEIPDVPEGMSGSAAAGWKRACAAVQRVTEDPTSHSARQEARALLAEAVRLADLEETQTLVPQHRLRLRVRYELAVMRFEDVMAGGSPEGVLEELFQLLELLSDPDKDPFDNTRRPHPSPSPWFAPDHSNKPLVEVDEIRCMLAQLALHPATADLTLAQHHYREIGGVRYFPSSRQLLAADWPAPDQSMAWVNPEKEDMKVKKNTAPSTPLLM